MYINIKEVYEQGYFIGKLDNTELNFFKNIINLHFQNNLKKHNINFDDEICQYHKLDISQEKHKSLWPKENRILNQADYNKFLGTEFFSYLKTLFGTFEISDENNVGHPEIYFRIVRPYPFTDVTSLHADSWFRHLGHGNMPEDCNSIKFWFSIYPPENLDNSKLGFRFVPNSHQNKLKYDKVYSDGIYKPVLDEVKNNIETISLKGSAGSFIVFHDDLIHGGEIVHSDKTRCSFEFSLWAKKESINKHISQIT